MSIKVGDTVKYGAKINGKIKVKTADVVDIKGEKIYLSSTAVLHTSDQIKKGDKITDHHDFFIVESISPLVKMEEVLDNVLELLDEVTSPNRGMLYRHKRSKEFLTYYSNQRGEKPGSALFIRYDKNLKVIPSTDRYSRIKGDIVWAELKDVEFVAASVRDYQSQSSGLDTVSLKKLDKAIDVRAHMSEIEREPAHGWQEMKWKAESYGGYLTSPFERLIRWLTGKEKPYQLTRKKYDGWADIDTETVEALLAGTKQTKDQAVALLKKKIDQLEKAVPYDDKFYLGNYSYSEIEQIAIREAVRQNKIKLGKNSYVDSVKVTDEGGKEDINVTARTSMWSYNYSADVKIDGKAYKVKFHTTDMPTRL